MSVEDTVWGLSRFGVRASGSDAERRAALWLVTQLESPGREVRVEPFWSRPNWALAHCWHVALGVGGGLLSVSEPRIGGVLVLLALLSVVSDALSGRSPGRRLTPERASQNVVRAVDDAQQRTRLIITANYDAGRGGLIYRRGLRAGVARLSRLGAGRGPGWQAMLALALAWLLVIAIIRLDGTHSTVIGVLQLIPTVALVLGLALLLEQSGAGHGPAAGDNASGVAVALALARALDAAPPGRLAVELVLQGAGEGGGSGLRAHLRARRRQLSPRNTIVLGIAACGAGEPRWWVSDGQFVPLRYHPRLRALAAGLAAADPELGLKPRRGRGATPALPARVAGLPAIAIGCLDEQGLVPRSHTVGDTPDRLDTAALDATLEVALMLVDELDVELARQPAPPGPSAQPGRFKRLATRT